MCRGGGRGGGGGGGGGGDAIAYVLVGYNSFLNMNKESGTIHWKYSFLFPQSEGHNQSIVWKIHNGIIRGFILTSSRIFMCEKKV